MRFSPQFCKIGWAALCLAGAVVGIGGIVLLYNVNPSQGGVYPPCMFHYLTGLNCPGCGTTRAIYQLLHGNIAAALAMNALAVCAGPVLLAIAVCRWINGRPRRAQSPFWPWLALFILVGFTVLRNIPAYPFTLLAPHELTPPATASQPLTTAARPAKTLK